LWIRVVLLCILFGWGAFEFLIGAPFWGVIFTGIGVVALVQWFFSGWANEGQASAGVDDKTFNQNQSANGNGASEQGDDS